MFDTQLVSDMQSGVVVGEDSITGTLNYLEDGPLADYWGPGNFMALKFSDIDPRATSVLVGMDPSQGSGLVEILGDPDMNGAFKVTDNTAQVFKVVTTDGTETVTQTFNLSDLELVTE